MAERSNKWTLPKRIVRIALVVTVAVILYFSIFSIVTYDESTGTSFPWWTGTAFTLMYGGPIAAVLVVLYIIFSRLEKKGKAPPRT